MNPSAASFEYVKPWPVPDIKDCYFYHRMDIPGLEEVKSSWDLRGCIGPYLGDYDFKGKRVLDVGSASGFLTYSMEKAGAEVVSFDMATGAQWDVVPQRKHRKDLPGFMARLTEGNR